MACSQVGNFERFAQEAGRMCGHSGMIGLNISWIRILAFTNEVPSRKGGRLKGVCPVWQGADSNCIHNDKMTEAVDYV
jgi:hypothetical protein